LAQKSNIWKLSPDPSTTFSLILSTDRQTDRQTDREWHKHIFVRRCWKYM